MSEVVLHPIDHALGIDLQNPSPGMGAVAFNLHANGQQPCFLRMAIRFRFRWVDCLALITPIRLASGRVHSLFYLAFWCFTFWTLHPFILYHSRFRYSLTPDYNRILSRNTRLDRSSLVPTTPQSLQSIKRTDRHSCADITDLIVPVAQRTYPGTASASVSANCRAGLHAGCGMRQGS